MVPKKKKKEEEIDELEEWPEEDLEEGEALEEDDELPLPEEEEQVAGEGVSEEVPAPKEDFDSDLTSKDIATSDEAHVLETASNVPVVVSAVIGQTKVTVRDLLNYGPGFVVDLNRSPGETVDIVAGGKLVARGELVEMDGKLGVKILKLLR